MAGLCGRKLIGAASKDSEASFYLARIGSEIDLVLNIHGTAWAIEITQNSTPTVSKRFYIASGNIQFEHQCIVYPGNQTASKGEEVQVRSMINFIKAASLPPRCTSRF